MNILIKANNVDITKQIRLSLRIEKNINDKVDVLDFQYRKFGNRTYVPKTGHIVEVFDGEQKIFGGLVIETNHRTDKEDVNIYDVKVKDYTHHLDRRLVAQTYKHKKPSEIAKLVVQEFAPEITTNNVDELGREISLVVFDYERPSDVISSLAKAAGADWFIDYDGDLHFKVRGKNAAPFNLVETIGDKSETHIKNSLNLRKSDKEIKNVIYVVGDDAEGPHIDEKVAETDGTQKTFDTIYKFAHMPEVKLDGVEQNVGVAYLNDENDFDCLWDYNEKTLTFKNAPAANKSLTVAGVPLVPLFVKLSKPDAEKGVYEYKIIDKTLKSYDAVRARARAEIDAYAKSIAGGDFRTYRAGLEVGQKIFVNSEIRGIENEEYIIQQIIITMASQDKFVYSVKMANVSAYDIVSFMRELLLKNERTISFTSNVKKTLMKIATFNESIGAKETYLINGNMVHPIDAINFTDTIDIKKNFSINLVWGDYAQTDIDDPNRTPVWDSGWKWPA